MHKFLHYLHDIPKLPETLIPDVYESIGIFSNRFENPEYEYYKKYEVTEKLKTFFEPMCKRKYDVGVHVVREGISIHKDIGRTIAFNYIIDTGGENAETCFYDDNGNLLEKHNILAHCWHRIDVSVNHNVINLTRPRIALTISPFNLSN